MVAGEWNILGADSLGITKEDPRTTDPFANGGPKIPPAPPDRANFPVENAESEHAGVVREVSTENAADVSNGLSDLFDDDPTPGSSAVAPLPEEPGLSGSRSGRAGVSLEVSREQEALRLAKERDAFEAQLRAKDYLYKTVDDIIGVITQDGELQALVNGFSLTRDPAIDRYQREILQERVAPKLMGAQVSLRSPADVPVIFDLAYDELIGISVVGDLWRDDDVDEILIDSWNQIVVERYGKLEDTGRRFRSPEHANAVARNLSRLLSDRTVSNTNSLVTALLPGARVQFAWGNVVKSGLSISIRKFRELMGMDALLRGDSLNEEMRAFLHDAVRARATILVSGGTGTGKTTMINALSESIPDTERVITIEDAYELTLANHHVVSLQAKARSSADDSIVVTQEDLMVASLRMRPDRIIVGEIREPSAAAVMLAAANTGHDGTMTTLHASSTLVALNNRLTSLLMRSSVGYSDDVARSEVSQAIDLVVHISRRGGHRFVSEIALVDPAYVGTTAVQPLPLFVGEVTIETGPNGEVTEVHPSFRNNGKVPRASQLGVKLSDMGPSTARWIS